MKLKHLIDIIPGNFFGKIFAYFGKLDPKSMLTLIFQPTAINQGPIVMILLFFTCENIENRKH